MRQFLWLYLRAWVWARLPAWPRCSPALWGWLALGAASAASLLFRRELWPHTPEAGFYAGSGLGLAGVGSAALGLRGLGRWLWAAWRGGRGLARVLGLIGLLLAAGLLATAILGLLACAVGMGLLGYALG